MSELEVSEQTQQRHRSCSLKFIYLVLQTGKQSQVKHHDLPSWLMRHMWVVLSFQDICQDKCTQSLAMDDWSIQIDGILLWVCFFPNSYVFHSSLTQRIFELYKMCKEVQNAHIVLAAVFVHEGYSCGTSVSAGIQWLAHWHFSKEDICLQGGHSWEMGTIVNAAHIFALWWTIWTIWLVSLQVRTRIRIEISLLIKQIQIKHFFPRMSAIRHWHAIFTFAFSFILLQKKMKLKWFKTDFTEVEDISCLNKVCENKCFEVTIIYPWCNSFYLLVRKDPLNPKILF